MLEAKVIVLETTMEEEVVEFLLMVWVQIAKGQKHTAGNISERDLEEGDAISMTMMKVFLMLKVPTELSFLKLSMFKPCFYIALLKYFQKLCTS